MDTTTGNVETYYMTKTKQKKTIMYLYADNGMLNSFSGDAVPKHLPSSKILNGIEK